MHPWRAKLLATRDRLQEDEEDDNFALRYVIGLDLGTSGGSQRSRVHGGSRPGKAPNIVRDREEMHN